MVHLGREYGRDLHGANLFWLVLLRYYFGTQLVNNIPVDLERSRITGGITGGHETVRDA